VGKFDKKALIRNIADAEWHQLPGHFGGALSKLLVHPDTTGSEHIDYRISHYQPMARVEIHAHRVQEQIYHVLRGVGMMEVDNERRLVREHDVVFIPPGVRHAISNTGAEDLTFLVITAPVSDEPA
jgi:mannose-6-phosphate isomerase-like protein (cupin superfamily)